MKKSALLYTFLLILSASLTACSVLGAQAVPAAQVAAATGTPQPTLTLAPVNQGSGPVKITGEFNFTNDFVVRTYFVEQAAALVDMHGFVIRDQLWEIPVSSQVLGFTQVDKDKNHGTYSLELPTQPEGVLNDVSNSGTAQKGVQIFAMSYWPNLYGGPYAEGDDRSKGWPTYLASVKTDTENKDEVTGGKLMVWAPDANQLFPTGFGADGLLFTKDDLVGPLPAGYSMIDLDQKPFAIIRDPQVQMTLYEPNDVVIKDYSNDSYSMAFQNLFDFVRTNYAFNGIQGKQPDWDKLSVEITPLVKDAEAKKDPLAYYKALQAYINAFHDGHVGLNGGQYSQQVFSDQTSGGYGFAIRETDDGKFIAIYILKGGPADNAGMKLGAVLTQFNDQATADAVSQVKPLAGPFSTAVALRYQQARYLLRAPLGTTAKVAFTNPGETPQTATLTTVQERNSFNVTSIYQGYSQTGLPVEFRILDSGVGYIKISSFDDDLNLIIRLFERALKTFSDNKVSGIIIDLRQNPGGSPLGLAGFLTDKEIPLGQLQYFSTKTGKFEPEGPPNKVTPNGNQYRFGKMVLMVDQACASACEIEAYGFSQVPGMVVVGEYPTGGIEAEVARGQFKLPEGMSMQVPTGRFILPNGSLFLEGMGVVPTVKVPLTDENLLSTQDVVLNTADGIASQPAGAGVVPSGPPVLATVVEAQQAMQTDTPLLESRARENYDSLSQAGQTYTYTIALQQSEPLAWLNGWCDSTQAILDANLKLIHLKYSMDGKEVPLDHLAVYDGTSGGGLCHFNYTVVKSWPSGEHHLQVDVTFDQPIKDGAAVYPAGSHKYVYNVYVKP